MKEKTRRKETEKRTEGNATHEARKSFRKGTRYGEGREKQKETLERNEASKTENGNNARQRKQIKREGYREKEKGRRRETEKIGKEDSEWHSEPSTCFPRAQPAQTELQCILRRQCFCVVPRIPRHLQNKSVRMSLSSHSLSLDISSSHWPFSLLGIIFSDVVLVQYF